MMPQAIAEHELQLELARDMASSRDPLEAAMGRAGRDVSLALLRWHGNEAEAGTEPALMAQALNAAIAHALAAFAHEHGGGQTIEWHLAEVARQAREALEGHAGPRGGQ